MNASAVKFHAVTGQSKRTGVLLSVSVGGRRTGSIRRDNEGYFYKPYSSTPGAHFPTLDACKASLL